MQVMKTMLRFALLLPVLAAGTASAAGDPAAGKALYGTCIACHGPAGQGNKALNAPKIAGLDDWYLMRQLQNYKKGIRGTHAEDTYGKQMAPMAMTLGDDTAIANVAAYIGTFPDKPAEATVEGDAARGEGLYKTCIACHGQKGEGNKTLNAPGLAGMSDWYAVTQLKNFKAGIRGSHADDTYGKQMAPMAMTLADDQAIADVVAYINTLAK
jgi:cytochrome c oxidase subunit 2